MKQDPISQADETFHDPFLARVAALKVLSGEQRMQWLEAQSASLRSAKLGARRSRASRQDEILNRTQLAIIDAQLLCLSLVREHIGKAESKKVR